MSILRNTFGFIVFFLFSSSFAASFDCTRSANKVEKTICSDNELSALDEGLSIQFKQLIDRTHVPKIFIEEQRTWIKKDRNSCTDASCLKRVYLNRITELSKRLEEDVACPIAEQALIGSWKGVESSDFEEMAFELDDGKRAFLSWRHQHIEMIGRWEFKDCIIHITHPDNSMLSFDYTVKKYTRGTLYLQETGHKDPVLYQRLK